MKAMRVLVVAVAVWAAAVLPLIAVGMTAEQCKAERHAGINACKAVLYGMLPSPECCQHVRLAHVECVCPIITPALAALVKDINRVVRLIEGCGRRVPRHFKCGSITTP